MSLKRVTFSLPDDSQVKVARLEQGGAERLDTKELMPKHLVKSDRVKIEEIYRDGVTPRFIRKMKFVDELQREEEVPKQRRLVCMKDKVKTARSINSTDEILNGDPSATMRKTDEEGAQKEEVQQQPVLVCMKDDIKNLDTLPFPPFESICHFLVLGGHYQAVASLGMANSACKTRVDEFLEKKKNIPRIESIVIKQMTEPRRIRRLSPSPAREVHYGNPFAFAPRARLSLEFFGNRTGNVASKNVPGPSKLGSSDVVEGIDKQRGSTNIGAAPSGQTHSEEHRNTALDIEIRVHFDSLPLRPQLTKFRDRFKSVVLEGELVCITIPMRDREDEVMELINKAVGTKVGHLCVDNMRGLEELQFVNRQLFEEKTRFESVKIGLCDCVITDDMSDELYAMVQSRSVDSLEFHYEHEWGEHCRQTDPIGFIEHLTHLTRKFEIAYIRGIVKRGLLGLEDDAWKNLEHRLNVDEDVRACYHHSPYRNSMSRISQLPYYSTSFAYERTVRRPVVDIINIDDEDEKLQAQIERYRARSIPFDLGKVKEEKVDEGYPDVEPVVPAVLVVDKNPSDNDSNVVNEVTLSSDDEDSSDDDIDVIVLD